MAIRGLRGAGDRAGIRARPGAVRRVARQPGAVPGAARAGLLSPRARRVGRRPRARRAAPAPRRRSSRRPPPARAGALRTRRDVVSHGCARAGARATSKRPSATTIRRRTAQHTLVYGGYDPGVACSLWLAWTLALMGRLDEAASRDREGLAARAPSRRRVLAGVGVPRAPASRSRCSAIGRVRGARGRGGAARRGARLPVRARDGDRRSGMGADHAGEGRRRHPAAPQGRGAVEATGASLVRPSYLGMLAAADAIEGQGESAAQRFDEALAEVERTGERVHEAGLLIGKSELLVADARRLGAPRTPRRSASGARSTSPAPRARAWSSSAPRWRSRATTRRSGRAPEARAAARRRPCPLRRLETRRTGNRGGAAAARRLRPGAAFLVVSQSGAVTGTNRDGGRSSAAGSQRVLWQTAVQARMSDSSCEAACCSGRGCRTRLLKRAPVSSRWPVQQPSGSFDSMKVAQGRVVRGEITTRARFPEGARLTLVQHDERPPIDLDPDEEAGVLAGIAEIDAGKGVAASRLRRKLRRR